MPRFIIGNGRTGQCVEVEARSLSAACHGLGWAEAECEAVRLSPASGASRSRWARCADVLAHLLHRRTPKPKPADTAA